MSLNYAAWLHTPTHTHSKSRSCQFGGENGGTDEGKSERGARLKGEKLWRKVLLNAVELKILSKAKVVQDEKTAKHS